MREKFKGLAVNLLLAAASATLVLAAAETVARVALRSARVDLRPFEPFFVSGDAFPVRNEADLAGLRGGPAGYGYEPSYMTYIYKPSRPATALDRSNFLFGHPLSRYDAGRVDQIAAREPEAVRIFVIGGSAAQGYGASGKENTWHAIMEGALRRRFHRDDIYVFNAAMGAYVSSQERIAFELAVAPRKPDLTIVMDGFNDLYVPVIFGVRPGDPYQTGYRYYQMYDTSFSRFVLEKSALARWLAGRQARNALAMEGAAHLNDYPVTAALGMGISNVYTANVRSLLGRGAGSSPVMVFFQPWRDYAMKTAGYKPISIFFGFYMKVSNDIRANFSRESRFVDISASMSDPEKIGYFIDNAHLNDQGQKALSEYVIPHVEREVEKLIAAREGGKHEP